MGLHVNFIEDKPGSDLIAQVVYYSTTGETVPCHIDVFINNMNVVDYSLPSDGTFTATVEDQTADVVVLFPSSGIKAVVGVSIREPTDPVSTSPQDRKTFWAYKFQSKP
jgi:hypothetical protein